ncbi:DUF1552 domain-containing protein [Lignipirellula cremea]|uniref:DUF1552 domain-containing protein n=1 Tax=Lignipirellula cremea TaxID=2528010 RepID=A0A518DKQ5_9BACT|nr:DUF1552 domain-containing protein [Lignipirellula cremea]QDU92417.1 hypothetical protein Pla8534_01650 [Lignipirellula cremea]
MTKSWRLSRRTALQGLGATIALPFLEAMTPVSRAAQQAAQPPVRLMFHWLGTATNMDHWFPEDDGPNYQLSRALRPLERHRSHFSVISGTRNFPELDYGGGREFGHNGAMMWLTSQRVVTGSGAADIKTHSSVDQIAAKHLGQNTRHPSLQLGIYKPGFHILSWSEHGTPLPTINSPAALFQRLFVAKRPSEVAQFKKNAALNHSLLDLVTESRHDLQRRLGVQDRDKLDQYLTSVRELEAGIARDEKWIDTPPPPAGRPPAPTAERSKDEWMATMYRLIALAFEADITRVVALAGDGPGPAYDFIPGVIEDWHPISHHNQNAEKLEQMARINEWSMSELAKFLDTLDGMHDANGQSILHNSLILTGDSMADGQHWGGNYPLLLAGHAGGRLKQGQHLKFCENPRYGQDKWTLARTPTSNLYLSMLQLAGAPVERFADSTGPLAGLA